jgi:hypothetical protein
MLAIMEEQMMLKIGEFARIGQVSIATLRHYDQFPVEKREACEIVSLFFK